MSDSHTPSRPLTKPEAPVLTSDAVTRRRTEPLLSFEYFESDGGALPVFTLDADCILINLSRETRTIVFSNAADMRSYTLETGQALTLPNGASYAWKWSGRTEAGIVSFTTEALTDFFERELETFVTHEPMFDFVSLRKEDFTGLAERIKAAVEDPRVGQEILLDAYSKEFLIALLRQYEDDAQVERYPARMERLADVVSSMRQNLQRGIQVQEMARIAGMSRSRFATFFKLSTGLGPGSFLTKLRVKEARHLLKSTRLSLSEIAARCGFSDQSHLNRHFKKLVGKTPKQFRKV